MNTAEVDSPDARQLHVGRSCSDLRIRPDQLQCVPNRLLDGTGSSGSVLFPPHRSFPDLASCPADEPSGKLTAQSSRPRSRRNSSAEITWPRSPSAMATSRAASSSALRVKVSSPSGASTVTGRPSAKDSPGTSILPLTTLPVVTRMPLVYGSLEAESNRGLSLSHYRRRRWSATSSPKPAGGESRASPAGRVRSPCSTVRPVAGSSQVSRQRPAATPARPRGPPREP